MRPTTLTIVLGQTREGRRTFASLRELVLEPLRSDLAFCGSAAPSDDDPILTHSRHVWNRAEPADWLHALDEWEANDGAWRQLVPLGPMFLGGAGIGDSVGSGAIVMYWRDVLRVSLTRHVIDAYEWFVITRSDFLWRAPHPRPEYLDPSKVYVLDGEGYGGVSDRHVVFHRDHADRLLGIARPIFASPSRLLAEMSHLASPDLNPERFVLFRLGQLGLADRVVPLPYMGLTVRHAETATRWSKGFFDPRLGLYVKYPEERSRARLTALFVRRPEHWRSFLGERPGLRCRAYRAGELAWPGLRAAYGWGRRATLRARRRPDS